LISNAFELGLISKPTMPVPQTKSDLATTPQNTPALQSLHTAAPRLTKLTTLDTSQPPTMCTKRLSIKVKAVIKLKTIAQSARALPRKLTNLQQYSQTLPAFKPVSTRVLTRFQTKRISTNLTPQQPTRAPTITRDKVVAVLRTYGTD
jgi:hypothetical protein